MKKLLLLLSVSALLFAGQGDYKSELSIGIGGVKPEGNLDLENQLNLGLRYGFRLEEKFFDMVEVGFERASGVNYEGSTQGTDINRFFANLIKEYDLIQDTTLYGLVGLGYEDFKNPMFDNNDDGFFQYGVGLKKWLTDDFILKAEVRHGITFDGNSNLFYNLGVTIPFGKTIETKVPVKSEPVVIQEPPKPEPVIVKEKPKPKQIVAKEEPRDDDRDGVLNKYDKCLTTPLGKIVDSDGCMKIVRLHINFAHDSYEVKDRYMPKIKEVVSFMNENRNYSVTVDGHTDARGSKKYNQVLSLRRANAVMGKLRELGVDMSRIAVDGYGESSPIATNDTEEGRAENRRVDASFNK